MNSKKKGQRGEVELANLLKTYGFEARRGQQYHGGSDSPDVVGLPFIHIECKRIGQRLNIDEAYSQADRDSNGKRIPVVMYRKNYGQWMATLSLDHLMLIVDWEKMKKLENEINER